MDQDEDAITLTRLIHAPVDELFAAWTDPALLEQWQADRVEFEPFAGGALRFETEDPEGGAPLVVVGEIVEFEEDRLLVERWRYGEGDLATLLSLTFEPASAESTRLTLVERSEAHKDPESRIFSIEAWSAALEELAELIE